MDRGFVRGKIGVVTRIETEAINIFVTLRY
jgi:hypothetical protein